MKLLAQIAKISMLGAIACGLAVGADYKLRANPATLAPGDKAEFTLDGPEKKAFTLSAAEGSGVKCEKTTCTAPPAPAPNLAVTGEVTVTATFEGGEAKTTLTLTGPFDVSRRGPWEGRVITGYHQAGAASADFVQNVMIDVYTVRPLSKHSKVWLARFNSWGNVRIASAPQQLNTPFVSLLQGLLVPQPGADTSAVSPLNTQVNELALSGEFQAGLEWNLTAKADWNGKMLGLIGYFGATGAFEAPSQTARIYKVPDAQSPQYPLFRERFPGATGSTYVAFVNPDRDRFYRQWGLGFRYSKFNPKANYESPLTFSITIGRDEAITGGRFGGAVARFEGFHPLPVGTKEGKWRFLYLFGTASLRLSRTADNRPPLILESAPDTVKGFQNTVAVVASPSNRDTYRIGIGVDMVNLMRSFFKP
jgi:hypothetical protein